MARGTSAPVGTKRVSQNGYHYTKTSNGWVLTHRKVAEEQILGRTLRADERVLFKNGNRLDLRPENLIITEVNSNLASLKNRRMDLIVRLEELQGQLADVEEEIQRKELVRESP